MAEVKGGGLGYIDIGSDALGLGGLGQGIGQTAVAKSVEGCGKRPLFGRKAWNDCVANQQSLKSQAITAQSTPPQNNNTIIIIAAVIAVVVVLVLVMKK
jgi:hypothetical protein